MFLKNEKKYLSVIMESQNHRMSSFGGDLKKSSSPIPLPDQEHLDQVIQKCVQSDF